MAIAGKKNYQVAVLWPKVFKELDIEIDSYTLILTSNFAAIIPKDYNKFFNKIWKKLYTKKELKQIIFSEYYNYIDI